MKSWDLFWSPEGRKFQRVSAPDARAARRKARQPYKQYLGEIYAQEVCLAVVLYRPVRSLLPV